MNRKSISKAIIALPLIITFACNQSTPSHSLKHSVGQPTRGDESWMWADLTQKQFIDLIASPDSIETNDLIFPDSKQPQEFLPNRIKYWIDRIDRQLRQKHPSKMKNVPAPQTVVLKNEEPNAYVPSVNLCLPILIYINQDIPVTQDNKVKSVQLSTEGEITESDSDTPCVKKNLPADTQVKIIKWFNENHPECKLTQRPNGLVNEYQINSNHCNIAPSLDKVSMTESIMLPTTPNWIVVHSGLVSFFENEEHILNTLAHELGHYYRSHMTTFPGTYDYFYTIKENNSDSRPKPEPGLKDFGNTVRQTSRLVQIQQVANQKLNSALFELSGDIIRTTCTERGASCSRPCTQAIDMLQAEQFQDWFGEFPVKEFPNTKAGIAKYRALEVLTLKCSESITIVKNRSQLTAGKLFIEDLQKSLKGAQIDKLVAVNSSTTTLVEWLTDASKQLTTYQQKQAEITLNQAFTSKLGWYTAEQEADEFGLEQTVELGISPEIAIESEFIFFKEENELDHEPDTELIKAPIELSIAECRKFYSKAGSSKWTTDQGEHYVPAISDYFDNHHSGCFRIYNMDKEINAHKYPTIAELPSELLERNQWQKIRDDAMEASSSKISKDTDGLKKSRALLPSCHLRNSSRI